MQDRRGFIRLLGGGTLALGLAGSLGGCDTMPAEAIAPWRGPAPDLRDPRLRMLAWALLAPNPHNRQPWLVDLAAPGRVTLYCDRERLLPATDPPGRQILIGQGTFLELLRLAARAEGFEARIAPFPEGPFPPDRLDGRPVAHVYLTPAPALREPLFEAVTLRRSAKVPFDPERPVAEPALARLAEVAAVSGIGFSATSTPDRVTRLREIARAAWFTEARTPAAHEESVALMRLGAAEIAAHRDGISLHGPMIWWGSRLGLVSRAALADPEGSAFQAGVERYMTMFDGTATFAWLTSETDRRADQLAAGIAYARLDLAAAREGIAIHPVSQALQEYPEMAAHYQALHAELGLAPPARAQMLVRLGHAPRPDPAPRRPVESLVI
ncbi:MAG: twin-arginine translocation pathway signal protein [Alphaproteobacteria bacterium]|nr:twin-arginine translocation pathway signal protein [Alphaproteobacteria bacterium]